VPYTHYPHVYEVLGDGDGTDDAGLVLTDPDQLSEPGA
jgi:hypothetical protein